jgi:hypothetical protein
MSSFEQPLGLQVRYWLKNKNATSQLLKALEKVVRSSNNLR